MTALTRRTVLRSFVAAPVAGAIGMPGLARAAEFSLKYGNNLPLTHPLNVRAQEAADRDRDGDARAGSRSRSSRTTSSAATPTCSPRCATARINFFTPSALVIATLVPVAAINAVGFAFADYDQVWKAMDGGLGAHVRAAIAKVGLIAFEKMWDNGFRQITSERQADREREGHGRPQDPRAGEPAQHLHVQGARRLADQPAVQRGLFGAADQDRRRAGESAADHPGREALRGAEVLRDHQPHLGRLLVHRQRPRLERPAGRSAGRSSSNAINDAGLKQREDIKTLNATVQADLSAREWPSPTPAPDSFRAKLRDVRLLRRMEGPLRRRSLGAARKAPSASWPEQQASCPAPAGP